MVSGIDFRPYRLTPRTSVRPRFDRFEPEYDVDQPILDALRRIERADERLRSVPLGPDEARRVAEEALTRNAFGTASIEGNPLTLDDVESLLARGPTPEALERPDEREILNYVAHMRRLDKERLPQDADDVARLHGILFEGVLPDAGRFKQQANFIGKRPSMEVTFVPATPERVRPELDQAFEWYAREPEHPLIKIAVFFHEFQGIHPFRDGNGRAGRALSTHQIHAAGYPGVRNAIIDYEFNADREAYYGALQAVESGGYDFTPWIRYWITVVRDTFERAVQRAEFDRDLPRELNDRQVQIARWFATLARGHPERRVKFGDVHAVHPTVPDRTLRRDLARLVEANVLESEGRLKATTYRMRPSFLR